MHQTKPIKNPPFHLSTETNPVSGNLCSLYYLEMDEVQTLWNSESHVNVHKQNTASDHVAL
jgi:hypothetical protein